MPKIEHVIVLMLENRSFDHVLGWLNQERPEIDGPSEDYKNPLIVGSPMNTQYAAKPTADWRTELPFDPPHEFADASEHLFGTPAPRADQPATMNGFVARAARENEEKNAQGNPGVVMEGFAPGRLPAIHALANEFAICQRWFASVPGPTWPNRFFAHCGSAGGYLDGAFRLYEMPSVFARLVDADERACVYFHDVPHTAVLTDIALRPWLLHSFAAFLSDAANGTLPAYSFIEPNYITPGGVGGANDQHPTAPMQPGDALIAKVYEAVRASPLWEKSLLLVVWDEHGGFFDHVPPGPAVPPFDDATGQYAFGFDRLGVRVPAVVVSPWIERGVVDSTTYEHASIPATLSALFGIAPLTRRDAHAASFDRLCTRDVPRDDAPMTLPSEAVEAAVPGDDVEDIDLGPAVGSPLERGLTRSDRREPPRRADAHSNRFRDLERKIADRLGVVIPEGKHLGDVIDSVRTKPGLEANIAQKKAEKARRKRPVRADKLDLRDRPYLPRVATAPPLSLAPSKQLPRPRDQEDTSACTGYSLALLVDFLLAHAERPSPKNVSPRMLYSMARRYDEFPGSKKDDGSSLRGALKGWFRHGVCRHDLWDDEVGIEAMPEPKVNAKDDWWSDALLCPLGAYYRIEVKAILDIQAAIVEVGAVYASAVVHSNWDDVTSTDETFPDIPFKKATRDDGGHAFVLVGYDADGFLVQNSWGKSWGKNGIARLTYEDWLAHAMDAWVVQLGVPTRERERAAANAVLGAKVAVASTPVVRDHQLVPYIVNAERGRLSGRGRFRTTISDLAQLSGPFLTAFEKEQGCDVVDVALVAHGGVVDEDTAAASAARWIPKLFARKVFPIFVMWESDIVSTARAIVTEALAPPAAGAQSGVTNALRGWLDRRIEQAVAPIGTRLWNEMKSSAAALTHDEQGLLRILFGGTKALQPGLDPKRVRLHLIGHSAGSIVHATLAAWLVGRGFKIASMTLLAPAIRVDAFERLVLPHVGAEIERLRIFCLDDASETSDPTIPIYQKSILCLLSHSFEGGPNVPILGMERYAKALPLHPAIEIVIAPGQLSRAHTHVAFDDDPSTIESVVWGIAANAAAKPNAP